MLTRAGRGAAGRRAMRASKRAGGGQPLGLEGKPGEFGEHVVVAVIVQYAGAVDVCAGGDQNVRWGRAAMVPSVREVSLGVEGRVLDLCVDPKARQMKEIGKGLTVVFRAACGPASFEQKWGTDRDFAVFDHGRDFRATLVR